MATLENKKEIEDFSDLGQSFEFIYNGLNYIIPPIPPARAKKLLKISSQIGKEKNKSDESKDMDMNSIAEDSETMFDSQVDFIVESGIKRVCFEENSPLPILVDLTKEEIEENWSTQLVLKIFEKITKIIFGSDIQEKKS